MHPLKQTGIDSLMKHSSGSTKITIGIIDGPIDIQHDAFKNIQIVAVNKRYDISCNMSHSPNLACVHGTFVTGILAARRGVDAPSICPSCRFALRPIFFDHLPSSIASTTIDLSEAIFETVNAGAKIINLSLGMEIPMGPIKNLEEACIYARDNDVIIVLAAGNQGRLGGYSLLNNEWVIPVAACDSNDRPLMSTNLGVSIGKYGVLAPGFGIKSTFPGNRYSYMDGTSTAAAFVTGGIALLRSLFPNSTSSEIIYSIRKSSSRRSVVPGVFDAEAASKIMTK